jgi:tetratricopeptide (TPR) repeat protein
MKFRDSPKSMPEIAAELRVRYVLGGGLVRATDSVRINVQLIDAQADDHIWADTYDRALSMENLLSVQSEIAQRVATELEAVLTPEEQDRIRASLTDNFDAYELYLLGRYRFVRRSAENLRGAIRYFEAAIEQDSTFALAWTGLASAWAVLPWYEPVPSREAYTWARDAAQRALELDEGLAEVHTALGTLALYYEWEWETAERHLLRAVELTPNYAQAHHRLGLAHFFLGRHDRAIRSVETAIRLNPLGNNFPGTLAGMLHVAGRVEEALALYRKAEKFDPPIPSDLCVMSLLFLREGLAEEGFRVIQRWGEAIGYPHPERLPLVLRAIEARELTEGALAVLEDVRRTTGLRAGQLAHLYLHLDAPAEALRFVQEGIAERDPALPFLAYPHTRAKVLENPEITAALQEAGVRIY